MDHRHKEDECATNGLVCGGGCVYVQHQLRTHVPSFAFMSPPLPMRSPALLFLLELRPGLRPRLLLLLVLLKPAEIESS